MSNSIVSSMAGTMWKVLVTEGSAFSAGDTVAILESMKMEIPIEAETSGTVETIHAPEGTVVDEGAVILTFI